MATTIVASRCLMKTALVERVSRRPVVGNRPAVVALLKSQMGSLSREQVVALYVDARLQLLCMEPISEGSVAEAVLDTGKIIHRALDVGAYGFVLVHNHPSGDPRPSEADQRATARLGRISGDLDIRLLDHLIVAGGEVRSMMEVERAFICNARS